MIVVRRDRLRGPGRRGLDKQNIAELDRGAGSPLPKYEHVVVGQNLTCKVDPRSPERPCGEFNDHNIHQYRLWDASEHQQVKFSRTRAARPSLRRDVISDKCIGLEIKYKLQDYKYTWH